MNRISILLPALSVVMVGVSCRPLEAKLSSAQPVPTPVFQEAIVARDEWTTVFIGRQATGRLGSPMPLPASLTTTFYGPDDTLLETVSFAPVQGARSGLVYAAPITLSDQALQNVKDAVRAQIGSGPGAQFIHLGQPKGTISEFKKDYLVPTLEDLYIPGSSGFQVGGWIEI